MYSANWTPRAWFYQGRGFYQVRSVVNRLDAGGGRALSLHLLHMGHRRIQGQGKGYGRQLMEYCLANAKAREKAGVCMLGAKTQKAWLSGQAFAEKYGFETVDTTPDGYRLLALSFDGTKPRFAQSAKRLEITGQELTIYYSPQCPYIHQSVALVRKTCQEMRAPYTLIPVDTLEKAKTLPGAFNNWAVFYQGKFVTVNLLDAAALKRFLKKGGYGVSAK